MLCICFPFQMGTQAGFDVHQCTRMLFLQQEILWEKAGSKWTFVLTCGCRIYLCMLVFWEYDIMVLLCIMIISHSVIAHNYLQVNRNVSMISYTQMLTSSTLILLLVVFIFIYISSFTFSNTGFYQLASSVFLKDSKWFANICLEKQYYKEMQFENTLICVKAE